MSSETSTTASVPTSGAKRPRGRRPSLSLEAIVQAAVGLLDEAGQSALTFRALSARMSTGVGAIYHYVSGRDELLDRATDAILDDVRAALVLPDDPFDALRAISIALFDGLQAHPWAGAYLMRDTTMQPNALRLFEAIGQQFLKLDLTTAQRFDGASSLLSFVVGSGSEIREMPAAVIEEGRTQEEHLQEFADEWRALDADEFPFLHRIADTFAEHDDLEQFQAGVDLFLDGVRAQVG